MNPESIQVGKRYNVCPKGGEYQGKQFIVKVDQRLGGGLFSCSNKMATMQLHAQAFVSESTKPFWKFW